MPILSTIGSVVGIASGVSNLLGGDSGGSGGGSTYTGQQAQAMADPFSAYRNQYAQQLNQLLNPTVSPTAITEWEKAQGWGKTNKKGAWSLGKLTPQQQLQLDAFTKQQQSDAVTKQITGMPGYQFELGQGTQALERQLAATGQTQSGNEQIALQKFGQGLAGQYYNSMLATLMQLSGASQNPAAGAQAALAAQSQGLQQNQAGWGALAQGLGGLRQIYGTSGTGYSGGGYINTPDSWASSQGELYGPEQYSPTGP